MFADWRKWIPVLLLSALLAAMFAAGLLVGLALHAPAVPAPPPPGRAPDLPPLLRALDLTPEQAERAREIGRRYQPQLERIRQRIRPEIEALFRKMNGELKTFLTPDQIRRLEELEKRRVMPPDPPPGFLPGPPS